MSRTARLGIFILSALILFAVGVFLIGKGSFLFKSSYKIRAGFQTVAGLTSGTEVRAGGVRIGTVSAIQLPRSPDGQVMVTMELDKSTQGLIRKDAEASVQTEGLIGNKFLRLTFGSQGAAPVNPGDVVKSTPTLDVSDLVAKTDRILDTTSSALKNIDSATSNLSQITGKINSGHGTIGQLVNNDTIYRQLQSTASTIQNTARQAQAGATGFKENMEALKHNWLFRGYFKKRGYTDESDLTQNAVNRIPNEKTSQNFILNADEFFGSDNAKLKHKNRLDDVGRYLQENPFSLAVIAAYADMRGDSQEELKITEARAYAVREYLVNHFQLNDARIKTKGLGKQKPEEGRPPEGIEVLIYGSPRSAPAEAQ